MAPQVGRGEVQALTQDTHTNTHAHRIRIAIEIVRVENVGWEFIAEAGQHRDLKLAHGKVSRLRVIEYGCGEPSKRPSPAQHRNQVALPAVARGLDGVKDRQISKEMK